MRARLTSCVIALLALGCLFPGGPADIATAPAPRATGAHLGAPDAELPQRLRELLRRGERVAGEWQDAPVLAEVEVDVDAEGRWTGARLVYLAPDADRFLSLVAKGGGFTQERPSLAGLQLQPVTEAALSELPEFPEGTLEPRALVTADDAAACDVTPPASVLYVTGAPVAWDGTAWSAPPQWRATVTADGTGAVLDVESGKGECLPD